MAKTELTAEEKSAFLGSIKIAGTPPKEPLWRYDAATDQIMYLTQEHYEEVYDKMCRYISALREMQKTAVGALPSVTPMPDPRLEIGEHVLSVVKDYPGIISRIIGKTT